MRIASMSTYREALADVERAAEELARRQREVSSGLRLETPRDDPLAVASVVSDSSEIATLDQYQRAADAVSARLSVADSVLSDMVVKLTSAKTAAVSARGSNITASQRQAAVNELQGIKDALLADFTTTFQGAFLFAGAKSSTAPYTKSGSTISAYLGDTNPVSVDINRSRAVQVTLDGGAIAQGSDTTDVFTAIDQLIADIQANDQVGVENGIAAMTRAFTRATQAQTGLGTDLSALEDERSRVQALRLATKARISDNQDANIAEAASGLSRADTAYRAALTSAATIGRFSLIDFLR